MLKIAVLVVLGTSFQSFAKEVIIYGEDNRVDINEVTDSKILDISKSVAAQVDKYSFNKRFYNKANYIAFNNYARLKDPMGAEVCSDERFANQPSLSNCSGFLIAPNLLATAGHCLLNDNGVISNTTNYNCERNDWLFSFENRVKDGFEPKLVLEKDLYQCKRIVIAKLTDEDDFAIIELDRDVTDRTPLKLRPFGKVKRGTSLYVIGHPSGLPKKVAAGSKVLKSRKPKYFSASLDTFGGNSGSPVFNAVTHEVEGILVRGKQDYIWDSFNERNCKRVNVCNESGKKCLENEDNLKGEEVTRITEILSFMK